MSEPKNSKDALEFIHTLDSLAIKKQQEEIERLCAWGRGLESNLSHARVEISFLKAEVERLTDAITRGALTPDARPDDHPL